MSQEKEEIRLLKEMLRWLKFAGWKGVKDALAESLSSDSKKIIYYLSDGDKTSVEIAKLTNISDWTVRNYWKQWSKSGLVEGVKAGRGERYRKNFDPDDFGFEFPRDLKIQVTHEEDKTNSQESNYEKN